MQAKLAAEVVATWVRLVGGVLEEMHFSRSGRTWFVRRDGRLLLMDEYHGLDLETVGLRIAEFGFVRGVSLRGLRELG